MELVRLFSEAVAECCDWDLDNVCSISRLVQFIVCSLPPATIKDLNIVQIFCVATVNLGSAPHHSQLPLNCSHCVSPPSPAEARQVDPPMGVHIKEFNAGRVKLVAVDTSGDDDSRTSVEGDCCAAVLDSWE